MKLIHAVALSLAGWLLIAPPPESKKHWWIPNTQAPKGQWTVIRSFDSPASCENGLDEWQGEGLETIHGTSPDAVYDFRRRSKAACIDASDPRLKKK